MRVFQTNISLVNHWQEPAPVQNKQSTLAGKPVDVIKNHPASAIDAVRDSNQCKGSEGSYESMLFCFDNKLVFSKFTGSLPGIISKLSWNDRLALLSDAELQKQFRQLNVQASNDMHNFVRKYLDFNFKKINILDSYTPVLKLHKLLQLQQQHELSRFLPLKNQEFLLKMPQFNLSNITRKWSYIDLVNSQEIHLPISINEEEYFRENLFENAEEYFRENLFKRIEERDLPFESLINPEAPDYDQIKKTVAEDYKILQERSIDWNTDQLEFDALKHIFDKQTETQNQILERLKTICDVEENATDASFKIRNCNVEPPHDVESSQYQLYALGLGILLSIGLYLKYRPFRRSNQEFLKQSVKQHWQTVCAKKNEACDRLQTSAIAARNAVQAKLASGFQSQSNK